MAQTNTYNSNQVPHSIPGGVATFLNADGSAIGDSTAGVRTVEDISIKREGVYLKRKGPYGGAGGFVIAGKAGAKYAKLKQLEGSGTIQVPVEEDLAFIDIGQYFVLPYRGKNYRCVVYSIGDAFKTEQYWTQRVDYAIDQYVDPANPVD
jgi:hypothetical protein